MDVFKEAWEAQVRILTDAVDDIVTVDDFLSVSENHILEDVNRCCLALQERDPETLDRIAGAIRGRSTRISGVVACEMENYEPGVYTERVLSKYFYLSLGTVPVPFNLRYLLHVLTS
jgi:catenin alpha